MPGQPVTLHVRGPVVDRIGADVHARALQILRLGYCFTPYQRLKLYNGAPFSRLLRHAADTEDVFSA